MVQELQNQVTPDVIIVDDVEVNRIILMQMVEGMGYTTIGAKSGEEALELVKRYLPKLFLLDISMPGISGFEVCEILKKDVRTRDIPVIFISAASSLDDKVMGFTLGGADFIVKPFALAEVTARVSMHLKNYEMKKEIERYNRRLNLVVNEQIKKIEEEKKNMLYAIAKITEKSVHFTENHMENVRTNAKILAQALQFSPKFEKQISTAFIETIEVAAPLHDLGKISIPKEILEKKIPLTQAEREIVKTHPQAGARILAEIYSQVEENEFIRMAIEIAEYHHERWDGKGYPKGLCGEEIPLAARIVNIVGSYDTMTGKRCYREALSPEECIEEMERDAGSIYDPDIFDIFKRIRNQLVIDT